MFGCGWLYYIAIQSKKRENTLAWELASLYEVITSGRGLVKCNTWWLHSKKKIISKVHGINSHLVRRSIAVLIVTYDTSWHLWSTHALNVYPQKRMHYPLNCRLGRSHSWSGQLRRRGYILFLLWFKPQTIQHVGNCWIIAQSKLHGVPGMHVVLKNDYEKRRLQQFVNYQVKSVNVPIYM